MATYDNGLYTPWTPADQVPPAVTQPAWQAPTTSPMTTTQWWTAPTTSSTTPMPSSSTTSTVPPTTTSSSSVVTSSSTSSSAQSSSSSIASASVLSSNSLSSQSTTSISSSSTHLSSSTALKPSGIIAASSSSDSSPPGFKVTYLLPVFIIVPCVLLFLLAAWTYGKYWAKPRGDGEASGRPQDQPGFWDGAYKSIGTKGRKGGSAPIEDEKEGLVIGKDWAGDLENATPKRKESSKWTNWLGRGNSTRSNGSNQSYNHVPFVSVSYASLDQPFVPPSGSSAALARSASQMSNGGGRDRGWTWGTKPQGTTSALRVMNGVDGDDQDESSRYLSAARGWNAGSTRKYRAKKNGSLSSRISDKVMSRLSPGGLSPSAMAPSPSVYSPQFPQDGGRYAELDEDEDDDLYDDEKKVDLDAYLGESRVGNGGMANRYLKGDVSAIPPPRRASGQVQPFETYPTDGRDPSFAVNLPSAPPRTQVSPKKSQSTLLRVPPPESPRATPPPQLLFGYESPPPPRGPLPVPSSQSRSNLASDPFTSPPARLPFRSQAAPQLSRPSRANTSTPFSPETAPALFFTSPPLASPPSQYNHSNVVGSPMPDFQPGALRASESAFSIAGVDNLIFSDDSSHLPPPPSNLFMNPRSESRSGLKDLAQKPKSRKEEIEQLRRSVGPPPASIPAPHHDPRSSSPLRNEQPTVAGFKSITTRPWKESRESLGFNPSFSESPVLAPLQHPSKVRAAIENLEAKSTSGHSKSSSVDSGRSGRSSNLNHENGSKPERLPSPPSPQKLERSTTTLGRSRRHHNGGGFGSEDDEGDLMIRDRQAEEDEERIMNRRVSTLLLSRSRTQSGPPAGPSSSSHDSHSPEGSSEEGWNGGKAREEEELPKRPLSSDPARLQQMLRRKSTGAGLGEGGAGVTVDSDGNASGGILAAMTRRSGIFD